MVRYAEALANRGLDVVTFNFLYMEARRGAPDRPPKLEACFVAVIDWARKQCQSQRFAIGGKSMGGRIASMVQAKAPSADALVFLGYPLHPPKQPDKLRAAHLSDIHVPMLFVQGERDPFGSREELEPILAKLPIARLHVVPSGDHSLSVPKRVRAQAEVDAELQDRIARFIVDR